MQFRAPQTPGIGGLDELTLTEEQAVQTIAALGTGGQFLRTNAGATAVEWATVAGGGDMVLADVQTVTGAKTFNDAKLILAGLTSGTTVLKSGAIAGASVITLPVGTDTLVGKATTDVFTNKSIDADTNTITNIDNADIKAAAAIAVNKLAALTASEMVGTDASGFLVSLAVATYPSLTELTYVKGVTSAIQTQLNAKQGTLTNSAGLLAALSDETGTGLAVFNTSPTLVTPVLGVASATSITASNAGLPATLTNTTDAASNQVLALLGERATPATNDEIYQSFYLDSSTGVSREMGRITTSGVVITNTSESSVLVFGVIASGSFVNKLRLSGSSLSPLTSDGLPLGSTSLMWSDLFLASGAVINFNNGNATLTHSAGLLTSSVPLSLGTSNALTAGTIELGHATDTTLARVSAGVVSIEGVNIVTTSSTDTLSNKTLTAPKLADLGFIADANGNELIIGDTVTSAVNEITVANAATTGAPTISATGGDTNINLQLTPKGTGIVKGTLHRFMVQLLSETTNQAVASTIGGDFRISNRAITVKAVGAYCDTAGTTGTFTVDINEAGTTILSTKITVDSTEKSSETAATPPVISDTAIAADAIITFDIDAIQTTAAKGLKVWIDYVYA